MNNLPCGVHSLPGERGEEIVSCRCAQCEAYLEFDAELEIWRFGGIFGRVANVVEHLGSRFCSRKCFSACMYAHAPEAVKTLLRTIAKAAYDLNEAIHFDSERWCLAHSYVIHLLPRTAMMMAATEAQELLLLLGAEDEGPDWFLEATEGVLPAKKSAQSAEVA